MPPAPMAIVPTEAKVGDPVSVLSFDLEDAIRFYLNGSLVVVDDVDPEATLLEYLRSTGLTGTKLGCAEGGCGACTVVVSHFNPTTQSIYHASVNACLAPLVSVDGKHVITIEGIGTAQRPHPVQERMAVGHGSQCGFCTPGISMSLYALLRNQAHPSPEDVEEAFDGNLCRCTGYRPILDAAQSFTCGQATANGGTGCCQENGQVDGNSGCCKDNSRADGNSGCCKENSPADGNSGCCQQTGQNGTCPENGPDGCRAKANAPVESELIFPPSLKKNILKPLCLGNKRKRWLRPVTVDQLLEIKHHFPAAKIIGGSTETQIEIKFKALQYPLSVYVGDIPELRRYRFYEDRLEIGANLTLTDLEKLCEEALHRYGPHAAQVFEAMRKQLKFFAGRQIRNVGTPAGNLVTASPISDLNPVLWAAGAVLQTRSQTQSGEIPVAHFFTGYRKTALAPDAILASIRVPVTAPHEYFCAYKQAKRKDDDIAIVTGSFRLRLNGSGVVDEASLVYGGMAATTVAAKTTEQFLVGRALADVNTLEGAMNALGEDFDLRFHVPGGMASYRRALAAGFFYRFYHHIMEKQKQTHGPTDHTHSPTPESPVPEIDRAISTGTRDHQAAADYEQAVVGRNTAHLAALQQTTGEAQYTDDLPPQRNELYGALVLSAQPHAKILSIDYSAALALPGVVDYVDRHDLPTPRANDWGPPAVDDKFFAEENVFSVGQPIAMILATSALRAQEAVRAVRVEYEALPYVLSIEDAIERESYHGPPRTLRKGDADQAFRECDYVFTGSSRMGGQEHFYLETHAARVVPKPENGELEVYASTQNANETQAYAAQVTGVDCNKVLVRVKRLGGGFGGKETRSIVLSSLVALAAQKTKRPVRCMLNRDEDIAVTGQRHPFLGRWKVGVDRDGTLRALDIDLYCNAGWSTDLSGAVMERAMSHVDGCYRIPHVHIRGHLCRTNTVSNTAFRGFGGPQGMFMAESMMSEVADKLGKSVDDLRQANFYAVDDVTHFNQTLRDWHVPLMYRQLREESRYDERRAAVDEFNRRNRWRKRGLALIPSKFGISFTALHLNQAGALVHIYHDGSVLVAHGGIEMGQGLHTKMTQVAAEALQVPLESVFISETSTNTVANASSTAASASSDLNGYAIHHACSQINERLAPYRAKLGPAATMGALAKAAYLDRVNLSAQGFYKTPDIGYDWATNSGQMFFYFTQGVAAAEVEVDTLTGTWTCVRADVKMDVGRSINPAVDYGQIEGAFVQGMGLFTMEESLWLRNGPMAGHCFTKGPGTYKIPGFRDIPQQFHVTLLKGVEWAELRTIQRSRGVGEPPLFLGSSVFFALRDALVAARRHEGVQPAVLTGNNNDDSGSNNDDSGNNNAVDTLADPGLLRLVSPATPERIRLACEDPIMKRLRVTPRDDTEKDFFVTI